MPLAPGTRLGSYELLSAIGKGGMGEVYRAADTRLKREVAIKVLPAEVASDPERLARFQREAEVLASLNHPNIAGIYGLVESDDDSGETRALVLELVEGPTLEDRIAEGPIPVDEALPIARQTAEALEAAHEAGIIHRDLKPANIKVRPDGTVKVLDFGLAKALEPAAASDIAATQSPTITTPAMTQMGMILGTAAYMSPEQARGKPVDKRADVFAFGAVLYEMLTGRRAFEGEDVSVTLADVIRAEPAWNRLPEGLSPLLFTYLQRCLKKDPKDRIRDIGDMRLALEGAFEVAAPASLHEESASPRRRTPAPVMLALGAVLGGVLAGTAAWLVRSSHESAPVVRFTDPAAPGAGLTLPLPEFAPVLAISPDGSLLVNATPEGLYTRSMDGGANWRRLVEQRAESLAPAYPLIAPDGRSVVYFDINREDGSGGWRKVSLTSGAAVTIGAGVEGNIPLGASWDADDSLVYGELGRGILRVSTEGGTPEVIVEAMGGEDLTNPQLLPGGESVLFTRYPDGLAGRLVASDASEIVVQVLGSGERRTVMEGASNGRYLPTGHLLYAIQGVLFARPFDLGSLTVTSGPVPVVQGVLRGTLSYRFAQFSVSNGGTLVYLPGPEAGLDVAVARLGIADGAGQAEALDMPEGAYTHPRVSPDGRRVAYQRTFADGEDIEIYQIGSGNAPRRLTFGGGSLNPVWSADGARIIFQSVREGEAGIFWQPADGTGAAGRLTTPVDGEVHLPDSVSTDGRWLSFTVQEAGTLDAEAAVWMLDLASGEASPFAVRPGTRLSWSAFSPDGRWLAYQSNETGQNEIFVQPFPATGAKYQLPLTLDNHFPMWAPDGRALFYVPAAGLFSRVSVTTEPSFGFGTPAPMQVGQVLRGGSPLNRRPIDVMPDGSGGARFLGILGSNAELAGGTEIRVVLNWFEELKARVPVE